MDHALERGQTQLCAVAAVVVQDSAQATEELTAVYHRANGYPCGESTPSS